MVVTPGDILGRCRALDARIAAASKAIEGAPANALDQAFRDAWTERARRWQEVRNQCADWSSRWWNYKWEPLLDDWFKNQAEWERLIEARTGQKVPVPAQIVPDEAPTLPSLKNASTGLGIGLGVAAAVGLGLVLVSQQRKR